MKKKIVRLFLRLFGKDVVEQVKRDLYIQAKSEQEEQFQRGFQSLASVIIERNEKTIPRFSEQLSIAQASAQVANVHLRYQLAYTIHLMKIVQPFANEGMYFDTLSERDRELLLQKADAILTDERTRKSAIKNGILPVTSRKTEDKETETQEVDDVNGIEFSPIE